MDTTREIKLLNRIAYWRTHVRVTTSDEREEKAHLAKGSHGETKQDWIKAYLDQIEKLTTQRDDLRELLGEVEWSGSDIETVSGQRLLGICPVCLFWLPNDEKIHFDDCRLAALLKGDDDPSGEAHQMIGKNEWESIHTPALKALAEKVDGKHTELCRMTIMELPMPEDCDCGLPELLKASRGE